VTRERGLGVRFRVRSSCETRGKKAKREESVPTGRRELQVLFFAIDQVACGLISVPFCYQARENRVLDFFKV
jgi:hypothetical protein